MLSRNMFQIDSTEDFSRFSGRVFDSNLRFQVPMYQESADLWYITFREGEERCL